MGRVIHTSLLYMKYLASLGTYPDPLDYLISKWAVGVLCNRVGCANVRPYSSSIMIPTLLNKSKIILNDEIQQHARCTAENERPVKLINLLASLSCHDASTLIMSCLAVLFRNKWSSCPVSPCRSVDAPVCWYV